MVGLGLELDCSCSSSSAAVSRALRSRSSSVMRNTRLTDVMPVPRSTLPLADSTLYERGCWDCSTIEVFHARDQYHVSERGGYILRVAPTEFQHGVC